MTTVPELNVSWQRAWQATGAAGHGAALCADLLAHYAQPHRKYHSLQHLTECLHAFASAREHVVHSAAVEIALWFHDAIYDVKRHDNEAQSAAWAQAALAQAGVSDTVLAQVHALIMDTCHTAVPQTPDAQLLVDVDLAILGAAPARFAEYEQQIRAEYSYVPGWIFRRKRREILKSFLARPRIYSTAYFYERLEPQARDNLKSAVR